MGNTLIEAASVNFREIIAHNHEIISVYLYGSCIYAPNKFSDLDFLIVLKDSDEPPELLGRLDLRIKKTFLSEKLDLNFVFERELEFHIHGERTDAYYMYIARTGVLIAGKPVLEEFKTNTLSIDDHYRRVVALVHRARHFYFNQIELDFWTKKFKKWTVYALAETYLYQTNELDGDLQNTARKFIENNEEFKDATVLLSPNTPSPYFYLCILEELRLFVERRFLPEMKKHG